MSNDYYNASGDPATSSSLASAAIRAEFAAIAAGFDKLAALAANRIPHSNAGATAWTTTSGFTMSASGVLTVPAGLTVTAGSLTVTGGTVTTGATTAMALGTSGGTILTLTNATGAAVTGTLSATGKFSVTISGKSAYVYTDASYTYFANTATANSEFMLMDTAAGVTIGVANTGRLLVSAGASSTSGIRLADYTTNGTVTTTGGTGVLSSASDATLKDEDGFVSDPLKMLSGLRGRYYYWKHEKEGGRQRQLGFFAQEVNAAIGNEAANPPPEGAKWGYYDRSVLAVAVDGINDLARRLTALEAR